RGALVAILSAGGFVGMTSLFRHWRMGRLCRREFSAEEVLITPGQNPLRTWLGVGILRLCLIGFIVVSVGFFDRIDPTFVAQDDSAGNRVPLWKGGLQMIASAPCTGWGVETSRAQYTQWFQPYDHTTRYAG